MNLFPSINIQSFGSSSKGNCTAIWDDDTAILIDFGFYPGVIEKKLRQINRSISSLQGVLLTHNHIDHINTNMVKTLAEKKIPIYCHEDIIEPTFLKYRKYIGSECRPFFRPFPSGEFNINSFLVKPFKVPHDAEGGCYGYNIWAGNGAGRRKISLATDIASAENGMTDNFIDSDVIIIESNHDVKMLKNSGRPGFLIKRIMEDGHLSNDECAAFIVKTLRKSKLLPDTIMLAHISQDCNTKQIAEACSRKALDENDFGAVDIVMTYCNENSAIVSL